MIYELVTIWLMFTFACHLHDSKCEVMYAEIVINKSSEYGISVEYNICINIQIFLKNFYFLTLLFSFIWNENNLQF